MNLRQHSRKRVSLIGSIFINHIKYGVHIQNLSFSGMLICIDASSSLYDEPGMFQLVQYSSIVGIHIENDSMKNKAEIVRVSFDKDNLIIAVKFIELDNLNKRLFCRKSLTAFGQIKLSEHVEEFKVINVSDNGMMIYLCDYALVNKGINPELKLDQLNLNREVEVVWVYYENGCMWLGLQL
ncbi:MAG: hypothetical protein GQ529_06970 [Methyloprofundus sp.]|nr:hypothetical protein [Methyloprofundus sp.]